MTPRFVGLVALREYLENIRTKGFWIGAVSVPFLVLGFATIPACIASSTDEASFAVVDQSGWVHDAVTHELVVRDVNLIVDTIIEKSLGEIPDSPNDARVRPVQAIFGEIRTLAEDPDALVRFKSNAADLIASLQMEATRVRQPILLVERFADWFSEDREGVIDVNADVSFARFTEMNAFGHSIASLQAAVEAESLAGFFIIPADPVASGEGARYVTANLTSLDVQEWYGGIVSDVVQRQRLRERNIDEATADWLSRRIDFEPQLIRDGTAASAEIDDLLEQWAPVGFVYLLWISIFSVAQMLLTNTVEEKANKLVEVILSSVEPIDLMAGKIIGIAATGTTMMLVWVSMAAMIVIALPLMANEPPPFDLTILITNPVYLGSFLVYFVLGYFFYAAFLAGIGSLCNNTKEAQAIATPINLLLFVPLAVMIPIGRDPTGLLAQVMTWLPPFTPFVMMNRAANPPDWWVYVGTTVLMIVSIGIGLRLAARLFRNGILMTGKPPRVRDVVALLRANDRAPSNPSTAPFHRRVFSLQRTANAEGNSWKTSWLDSGANGAGSFCSSSSCCCFARRSRIGTRSRRAA